MFNFSIECSLQLTNHVLTVQDGGAAETLYSSGSLYATQVWSACAITMYELKNTDGTPYTTGNVVVHQTNG